MSKLWALFDLFYKGSVVTDPALWKQRQITTTVLVPLLASLVAIAKAFGYDLPLTDAGLAQLAGGLVVVINLVLTLTTSDKVGLPPKEPRAPVRLAAQKSCAQGEDPALQADAGQQSRNGRTGAC